MKVLIRTDASTEIGTGHVMRCYVLAGQLRKRNVEVVFICRVLTGHFVTFLQNKNYQVIRLPYHVEADKNIVQWMGIHWEQDAKQTTAQLKKQHTTFDWMIIDHYGIDIKWERVIKPYVKNIMVIDDLANRRHDCRILLDQNVYPNLQTRYRNLIPTETTSLLGLNYLLLREEFYPFKNTQRATNDVNRILISFGGSDASNETTKTLKAIESLHLENVNIDVVIGSSNPHAKTIKTYGKRSSKINIHEQIDYVAELMAKADIAIGSGGSTTWERCYMGLPTITIETASNQSEILAHLAQLGAVCHLGKSEDVSEKDIKTAVAILINDRKLRGKMVMTLQTIMDGFDESRVVDYLLKNEQ